MTDKQINAAIAEACGWENVHQHPLNSNVWIGENVGVLEEIPDYCNDLNAMHEAENILSEDQMWRMAREIERNPDRWYFRATARERAEAFLRALGKWEEAQP